LHHVISISFFQHLPNHKLDLFNHHLLQSIDGWIRWELSALATLRNPHISKVAFAGVALVDFPGFRDTYHIIPKILDWTAEHPMEYHDPEDVLPEDWEAYLWYRRVLSSFLTDPIRARDLFVGTCEYIALAKYFWNFVLFG